MISLINYWCSGSFATVKEGICKVDETKWAIKCIDKKKLGPEDAEALKMEVAVSLSYKYIHEVIYIKIIFAGDENDSAQKCYSIKRSFWLSDNFLYGILINSIFFIPFLKKIKFAFILLKMNSH